MLTPTFHRAISIVVPAAVAATAAADVRLPALFGDTMVLQQRTQAPIWGWARAGEDITVKASWGQEATAKADDRGRWLARLTTPEAGGPHTVTVAGDNTRTLRNVLVGEVWLCSGQSNMEWPLSQSSDAAAEIPKANRPNLRLFTVANEFSLHEQVDCRGEWVECTPETAARFSAIGYYFGRQVSAALDVPVGLISADWGGTRIEAWMSEGALGQFKEYAADLEQNAAFRDPLRRAKAGESRQDAWWAELDFRGAPMPPANWQVGGDCFDDGAWKAVKLPATISGDGLENFDGMVCFRKTVELDAAWAGKPAVLELGPIDDRDETWINGVRVGAMREDGRWNVARRYDVPKGVLTAGKNIIAVRVLDTGGPGGINGKPEQMKLSRGDSLGESLSLAGEWRMKAGATTRQLGGVPESVSLSPNTATVLYNSMIAPLAPYVMRGAIWYQGESNRNNAALYAKLLPAMIASWRSAWSQGGRGAEAEFPFYLVQIAPFAYGGDKGETAQLREAQAAALAVPNTGMVVTLDVGDKADIHPRDKETVGRRLAGLALSRTYGRTDAAMDSPMFKSVRFDRGEAIISFGNARPTLVWKGGSDSPGDRGFWIAGSDKRFYPAAAEIQTDTVKVSSPKVPRPAAVRYAWAAAPDATLFNRAGLPAAPFRTDSWARDQVTWAEDGAIEELRAKDDAFKPLFSGKDLSGWVNVNCAPHSHPNATWSVANDDDGAPAIACSGIPTGVLRTDRMYENFVLEVEWRHLRPGGNAGIFVWSDALTARGQPFTRSVEVQVMDGQEGDWYTSDGDIFPIHGARMTPENPRPGRGGNRAYPTEKRMKPSPAWNHYRIECVNGAISLAVNGKVVTRGKDISPRKGYICLESEGSPVQFRNLRLKELPSAGTLPPEQVAAADEGFVPLYNGVDFTGWKFQKEHEGHWKATDWTITFDGKGTDLWTQKSYKDFVLICDWRWTEKGAQQDRPVILPSGDHQKTPDGKDATTKVIDAGDSGIFLRGSSKSQVNMWCWPIGSGEVYGYRTDSSQPPAVRAGVTPKEKADAPIGDWNRFIITMKGDTLTVVLNGKTVIDAAKLPGIAPEGPIALQKHDSPIQFGNIYIRELK